MLDSVDRPLCKILIVEDEFIVAADLESSLLDLGFDVVGSAGEAEEALAITTEKNPDLVLMDIQLRGSANGIDLANQIRHNWNIPVVFLTAYTSGEMLQKARAAGAYGFLSKPFRRDDLKAAILIALQQHRLGLNLFAEKNWLVTMLASLSDGVIAADANGNVRYINPAAERMTDWLSEDAVGKAIEDVYPLTHMDGSIVPHCQLRLALATRKPVAKKRFFVKTKGGGKLPVEDSAAPIIAESHLVGAVTIFRDISAHLQAEAEQEKEQGRLQQEVQTTSHALGQSREALRALSGRLITAQEDERRRVARELHDDLGQRAALMGWRIAELNRLAGAMSPEAQSEVAFLQADLNHLASGIRDVSHRLHPASIADLGLPAALRGLMEQQREQGVEITLVTRDAPASLSADVATALYRIAQETIRNAVQHAPEAPVLISLAGNQDEVLLSIEDPGPGFDLVKVRETGGLGLLSIQERARLLGGTLDLRTAPGEGTLVTVRVPLERSA